MARLFVLGGQCWSLFDPAVQTSLRPIYILCFLGIPRSGLCGLQLPRCAFGPAHNIQLIGVAVAVSDPKLNCQRERKSFAVTKSHILLPVPEHIQVCRILFFNFARIGKV